MRKSALRARRRSGCKPTEGRDLAGVRWGVPQVTAKILKEKPALALPPLSELLNRPSDATLKRKLRREAEEAKQRAREAARVRKVDDQGRATALGRRKTASARVWLSAVQEGSFSTLLVNGRLWTEYFPNVEHRAKVCPPPSHPPRNRSLAPRGAQPLHACTVQSSHREHRLARVTRSSKRRARAPRRGKIRPTHTRLGYAHLHLRRED
jgi:hypothetical protein